jgi:hypothetical protein
MEIPENKYLGVLCKRGHDYEGTGKSLKYNKGRGCCECFKMRQKEYAIIHPERSAKYSKKYNDNHKEKIKEYRIDYKDRYRKWCIINKEKIYVKRKEYEKIHNKELREYYNEYRRIRRKDAGYRFKINIKTMIYYSLKGNKKNCHWERLLDYSVEDLRNHLEKQFKDGMSWDNYGKWHVDHIIPISVFNFSSYDHIDFKRCWALSNLQPMWAMDNMKKSNKIKQSFQPCLKLGII